MIRLLVVEDHPVVRSGIVALLATAADEVVGQLGNGRKAVEEALRLRPDVVLMDLNLPELGGVEATSLILAGDPAIRVVVLTAYADDEQILRAIEAGASGYLLKAAPEDEVLTGIRSAAAGALALTPSVAARLVRQAARQVRPTLTARETEVLALVAHGNSNASIARTFFINEATVKSHLLHVFDKLEVQDRTRAVTLAMELGLLPASQPRL